MCFLVPYRLIHVRSINSVVPKSATQLTRFSFDPASLAILERIDQLEGKLHARNQSAGNDQRDDVKSSTHSTPGRRDSTFRTNSTSKGIAIINVEKILSWPIFHHRFDAHLKLKPLLEGSLSAPDHLSLQAVDRATAVGDLEIESCSGLLDVFFNYVHITNPVLDEKLVRQWARDVCLNGISWSAQSCLVVGNACCPSLFQPINRQYSFSYALWERYHYHLMRSARMTPFPLADQWTPSGRRHGSTLHKDALEHY